MYCDEIVMSDAILRTVVNLEMMPRCSYNNFLTKKECGWMGEFPLNYLARISLNYCYTR